MSDQQYTFEFRTVADLAAAEKTRDAFEQVIDVNKRLGKDTEDLEKRVASLNDALKSESAEAVRVDESMRKAGEAMKQAGQSAAEMEKARAEFRKEKGLPELSSMDRIKEKANEIVDAYSSAGGGLMGLFNAWRAGAGHLVVGLVAVKTAADGLRQSVTEFANAEKDVMSLNAALAQHGQLLEGVSELYQEIANRSQFETGISESEWLNTLKTLTQRGATPQDINTHLEAVKNLTDITGDLGTATTLISRAMEGQFQMFSRYGIVVREAGSDVERLNNLYQDLAQKGGGQLEAQQNTLIGQWKTLKLALGDVAEGVGQGVSKTGILQGVLYGLGQSAQWLAGMLAKPIEATDGLTNRIENQGQSAKRSEAALRDYAKQATETATAMASLATAIESANSQMREQSRQADEMENAEMADALSRVDAQVSAGTMRPERAVIERNRIRSRYRAQAFVRKQGDIQDRISRDEMGLEQANEEMGRQQGRMANAERYDAEYAAFSSELQDAKRNRRRAEIDLRAAFAKQNNPGIDLDDTQLLLRMALEDQSHRSSMGFVGRNPYLDEQIAAAQRLKNADQQIASMRRPEGISAESLRADPEFKKATEAIQAEINRLTGSISKAREELDHERRKHLLESQTLTRQAATEQAEAMRSARENDLNSRSQRLELEIESSVRAGQNPASLFRRRRQIQEELIRNNPGLSGEQRSLELDRARRQESDALRDNQFDPQTGRLRPRASNEAVSELQGLIEEQNAALTSILEFATEGRRRIAAVEAAIQNARNLDT